MSSARPRQRALVTGASSGIGAAFAERLARDGYDVVLVARRRERLEALAERLRHETEMEASVVVADLTDIEALAEVEARVAGDESLALLVNNAGFGRYGPFVQLAPDAADDLIDIHVRAVTRLTRAALPGMVRRGAGGVINVSSLLALSGSMPPNPLPPRAVYAGAKAFMLAFTQALSGELTGTGVTVQACLPGLVVTEFHTIQGWDPSRMPPRMTAPDVVTASLAALRRGEVVCIPGLEDATLLERLAEIQRTIVPSGNKPTLAPRYQSATD